jgi:hypothetical protein
MLTEAKIMNEVIPVAVEEAKAELTMLYAKEKGAHLLQDFINQMTLSTTMKQ